MILATIRVGLASFYYKRLQYRDWSWQWWRCWHWQCWKLIWQFIGSQAKIVKFYLSVFYFRLYYSYWQNEVKDWRKRFNEEKPESSQVAEILNEKGRVWYSKEKRESSHVTVFLTKSETRIIPTIWCTFSKHRYSFRDILRLFRTKKEEGRKFVMACKLFLPLLIRSPKYI